MKADPRFAGRPKHFWANVRSISQQVGYTAHGTGRILVPTLFQVRAAFTRLSLSTAHIASSDDVLTVLGSELFSYFQYRSDILYDHVRPRLMDAITAKSNFERLNLELVPTCPIPMNKQKGDKRAPAYFTGIVNMLIEANLGDSPCNYDPRELTTVTFNGAPLRTLARRVDGAFPSPVNPVAVWEIKEYYYTTTFGSRVADGVYESLLDGMELEELRQQEGINIQHVLMVDGFGTWWNQGKSYLCRIIDMLNMGYLDEVLFGLEVTERLPNLVSEWAEIEAGRIV